MAFDAERNDLVPETKGVVRASVNVSPLDPLRFSAGRLEAGAGRGRPKQDAVQLPSGAGPEGEHPRFRDQAGQQGPGLPNRPDAQGAREVPPRAELLRDPPY